MSKVFISYSQDDDAHAKRVRDLADRLRADSNLEVALDQYVSPKSINEEWARWCEKQLELADQVLIVITETYSRRFQRKENPGVGCGASFEAKLIYDELYKERGQNGKYRVVLFDAACEQCIPPALLGYDSFRLYRPEGYARLDEWLAPISAAAPDTANVPIAWPAKVARDWDVADRHEVTDLFARMLSGQEKNRVLLINAESGSGKTHLMGELRGFAREAGVPCSLLDCKGCPSLGELFENMFLALPSKVLKTAPAVAAERREYSIIQDLRQFASPVLMIFDGYEMASGDTQKWLETKLLHYLDESPALIVVVAGQKVPDHGRFPWAGLVQHVTLKPIEDADHWYEYTRRKGIAISLDDLKVLTKYSQGRPDRMQMLLPASAGQPISGAAGA